MHGAVFLDRSVARRRAWLLVAAETARAWPYGFLSVVLPIYLKQSGYDPLMIGAFFTVSGLVCAVLLIGLGPFLDRRPRKLALLIGSILPAVSFLLLSFSTEGWTVITAAILGGIGLVGGLSGALTGAAAYPLLFENTGAAESTRFFSWNTSGWLLAATLGSFSGGIPEWLQGWGLTAAFSYRLSFILCAVFSVVAGLLVASVRESFRPQVNEKHLAKKVRAAGFKLIIRYSVTQVFLGAGVGFLVQLLSLWFFLKFQVNEAQISPWFAGANCAGMVAVLLVPMIERKRHPLRLIVTFLTLTAIAVLLMAISDSFWGAGVLYLARTAFANMAWPAQNALLFSVVPAELRSSAASWSNAAFGLFSSLTPLLGGALMRGGFLDLPIFLGALAFFLAGISFLLFFHQPRSANGPPREPGCS